MDGYAGKILRIDLTNRKTRVFPTSDYAQWIGGHAMGSAVFFDLVKDKSIDGFDPANVVTIMTSPLSGTLTPAASGRSEVQGIGVQSYPVGWYTRSNFGGRFAAMLKYAGWDGMVLEGKADQPVWIDVRNEDVQIRNCKQLSLWGMDTWQCQQTIWKFISGGEEYGDWMQINTRGGQTTQRPAVLAIGPAGENLSRMACLIHDASNGSGSGGFGAVWSSKNLKAVSVIGDKDIQINDPKALMQARLWQKRDYAFNLENLKKNYVSTEFQSPPVPGVLWGWPPGAGRPTSEQRPQACIGCHSGCRGRFKDRLGNEATCFTTLFYMGAGRDIQRMASDLLNKYGLNAHEMFVGSLYLQDLHRRFNAIGPGKEIDCPLEFQHYGTQDFLEKYIRMIAYRNDGKGKKSQFGDTLAEGFVRAAKAWGRLDGATGDLKTGCLQFPFWGLPVHKPPTLQLEWGYGSILGDRDINEHGFDWLKFDPVISRRFGGTPQATAEEAVKIYTDKMVPFQGDMLMLDYSDGNMYSEHMVKLVTWHRYYTRFWKQSALFCDWRWPDFLNLYAPHKIGSTGIAEPKFLNAVTGKAFSFKDGMALGKRIWNLDHAIWTLQGRHRDMVHFADYIYSRADRGLDPMVLLPGRRNGKWEYLMMLPRRIEKNKFEDFKTRFYRFQGWNTATGYPTRASLQSLGMGYVADELERNGKLGKA
jgi:aldehyde:ferredoxin oxidoreductase